MDRRVDRYLALPVKEDLSRKMVFVGGPRQVGKTTFALTFLRDGHTRHPAYLNWDFPEHRRSVLRAELPPREPLVILDEVHKYARWRNLLKGWFDRYGPEVRFLVTGSARLDHYRKGGDSLQGRYHYFRLHPFSLREVRSRPSASDARDLLRWGGFPEPFLGQSDRLWRRWQAERLQRVVHEDLRDLERVREVSLIELLLEALPSRVGSPLSVQSLREDLGVSHEAVERWLTILENLYVCFRIPPYGAPRIRAVRKERKLYFWDWSQAPEGGARFENLVASQLLKYCHLVEDTEGYRMELRFLRDTDRREVDFVVLRDRRPLFAVECKSGERQVPAAIEYFRRRTPIPRFFQVHLGEKDFGSAERTARVLPFHAFCEETEMP